MRILHYSLGIYPNRTGGLNKYATDLVREQMKEHEVAILYPNGYKWWRQSCYISKPFVKEGIKCYRLVNSTPVPLFYGVKATESFISRKISISSFEAFLDSFRPEVIHLHTLMGLPDTALKFFKGKGARIIYTSHDYFGICPKVNLINQYGELCDGPASERCASCNRQAPSGLFLRLRNSNFVLKIRDLVRWTKNMLSY